MSRDSIIIIIIIIIIISGFLRMHTVLKKKTLCATVTFL